MHYHDKSHRGNTPIVTCHNIGVGGNVQKALRDNSLPMKIPDWINAVKISSGKKDVVHASKLETFAEKNFVSNEKLDPVLFVSWLAVLISVITLYFVQEDYTLKLTVSIIALSNLAFLVLFSIVSLVCVILDDKRCHNIDKLRAEIKSLDASCLADMPVLSSVGDMPTNLTLSVKSEWGKHSALSNYEHDLDKYKHDLPQEFSLDQGNQLIREQLVELADLYVASNSWDAFILNNNSILSNQYDQYILMLEDFLKNKECDNEHKQKMLLALSEKQHEVVHLLNDVNAIFREYIENSNQETLDPIWG